MDGARALGIHIGAHLGAYLGEISASRRLSAAVAPRGILRREEHKVLVGSDCLVGVGHVELAVVVEQPAK